MDTWRTFAVAGAALFTALWVAGCASPTQRINEEAADFGFEHLDLKGNGFRLNAFFKPAKTASTKRLHVYLEGDGTPWVSRWTVSDDPTPRDPVMLRLMALDESPALYLGRPCYYGYSADSGCSPVLWTHRRYGPEVIDGLADALQSFLRNRAFSELVLFGHSGGGALAVLLAPRFPQTSAVVTLAGNLDIDAWTAYHGYSPLAGSLNPAETKTNGIAEYHYFGETDRSIPPSVFEPVAKRRPHARVFVLPDFDHRCCWQEVWKDVLRRAGCIGQDPATTFNAQTHE
ncbi:alpha/beta hydrolase [Methylocaldum sp.]|uniref:alpha/beta fold hydrolase n=1 Tax=Methylocaldum sp. TaxID=1969727 RepID=UPI002D5B2A5F|nr:alpha/beta hydrolase [Methylocaldum sp.]HYE34284.1 alpha/beta hydrolase [Methylocaldum sp.]